MSFTDYDPELCFTDGSAPTAWKASIGVPDGGLHPPGAVLRHGTDYQNFADLVELVRHKCNKILEPKGAKAAIKNAYSVLQHKPIDKVYVTIVTSNAVLEEGYNRPDTDFSFGDAYLFMGCKQTEIVSEFKHLDSIATTADNADTWGNAFLSAAHLLNKHKPVRFATRMIRHIDRSQIQSQVLQGEFTTKEGELWSNPGDPGPQTDCNFAAECDPKRAFQNQLQGFCGFQPGGINQLNKEGTRIDGTNRLKDLVGEEGKPFDRMYLEWNKCRGGFIDLVDGGANHTGGKLGEENCGALSGDQFITLADNCICIKQGPWSCAEFSSNIADGTRILFKDTNFIPGSTTTTSDGIYEVVVNYQPAPVGSLTGLKPHVWTFPDEWTKEQRDEFYNKNVKNSSVPWLKYITFKRAEDFQIGCTFDYPSVYVEAGMTNKGKVFHIPSTGVNGDSTTPNQWVEGDAPQMVTTVLPGSSQEYYGTGAITFAIYLDEPDEYSYCMLPKVTSSCKLNGSTQGRPRVCTSAMTEGDGEYGLACKAFIEGRKDDKHALLGELCSATNSGGLQECDCIAYNERVDYWRLVDKIDEYQAGTPLHCWWTPCKPGSGRWPAVDLINPDAVKAPCTFCGNITYFEDIENSIIGEIIQDNKCTDDPESNPLKIIDGNAVMHARGVTKKDEDNSGPVVSINTDYVKVRDIEETLTETDETPNFMMALLIVFVAAVIVFFIASFIIKH
jgi:hypothetical protein